MFLMTFKHLLSPKDMWMYRFENTQSKHLWYLRLLHFLLLLKWLRDKVTSPAPAVIIAQLPTLLELGVGSVSVYAPAQAFILFKTTLPLAVKYVKGNVIELLLSVPPVITELLIPAVLIIEPVRTPPLTELPLIVPPLIVVSLIVPPVIATASASWVDIVPRLYSVLSTS